MKKLNIRCSEVSLIESLERDRFNIFASVKEGKRAAEHNFFIVTNYGELRIVFPLEINIYRYPLDLDNDSKEILKPLWNLEWFKASKPDSESDEKIKKLLGGNVPIITPAEEGIEKIESWYKQKLLSFPIRDSILYEVLRQTKNRKAILAMIPIINEWLDDLGLPYFDPLWRTIQAKRYHLTICKQCLAKLDQYDLLEGLCSSAGNKSGKCEKNYIKNINNWFKEIQGMYSNLFVALFSKYDTEQYLAMGDIGKQIAEMEEKNTPNSKRSKLRKSYRRATLLPFDLAQNKIKSIAKLIDFHAKKLYKGNLNNLHNFLVTNPKINPRQKNPTFDTVMENLKNLKQLLSHLKVDYEDFLNTIHLFPLYSHPESLKCLLGEVYCVDKNKLEQYFDKTQKHCKLISDSRKDKLAFYERNLVNKLLRTSICNN